MCETWHIFALTNDEVQIVCWSKMLSYIFKWFYAQS